ncbi:MAG TPA: transposase [Chloroflexota bacterium]|nr:transposase [Chloroflexota bacterium]
MPKDTTGSVEAIRQLRVVRTSVVKARTAALAQLGELITTAPAVVRERFGPRASLHERATLCARLRPNLTQLHQPVEAARVALRSLGQRIVALDAEIAALEAQLTALVTAVAPRTTALLGLGCLTVAQLLITLGQNADRIRDEAAFAHVCGVSPIPASSGKTSRHRLNRGGDREANSALYLVAVCRLRYCERTRAYAARRTAEGRSKPEILRCLKRYVAREVYASLRADLALHTPRLTTA